MHSGWVSQAHSQMQASTTSLDGDDWAGRRAAQAQAQAQHNSTHQTATVHNNPTVIIQPKIQRPRYLNVKRRQPRGHVSDAVSASSSAANGDTDDTDDEMPSLPRYGSVNMSERDRPDLTRQQPGVADTASLPTGPEEDMADHMRRRLRFYFMNPLEKWDTKRQFPYKLTIQLIKIFFVTLQLLLCGSYRYASVNYGGDNRVSFAHLFINQWDSGREITSYPPNTGPLALYTKADFYIYMDYAINSYRTIQNTSIGPYFNSDEQGNILPAKLCIERYVNGVIFGFNESFVFDSNTESQCLNLTLSPQTPFSMAEYLEANNFSISFVSLLEADLTFGLKTVRFRDLGPLKSPDCFNFDIMISFNNRDHDGQMLLDLSVESHRHLCSGTTDFKTNIRLEKIGRSAINYIVIALSLLSLFLCCRAIYRAQLLKAEVVHFFKKFFSKDLTVNERITFLNFWYLLIIFNDILIIIGSAIKEEIENKELTGDAWNVCSMCLGVGNLLVWFGVLRYLGFFRTYNVLILTLKRAFPNVIRFLICAILIYAGFTFCGWLILGPYHMKFSSLSTTSECLFALINGDDMFATFAGMSNKSTALWWFCRIYLYSFISLFIYVVLSLFIALIMDAYETIKLYYTEGFPRSALDEFINGPNEMNISTSTYSPGHGMGNIHSGSHNPFDDAEAAPGRKVSVVGALDTILEHMCVRSSSSPSPDIPKDTITRQASTDNSNAPLLEV